MSVKITRGGGGGGMQGGGGEQGRGVGRGAEGGQFGS